MRLISGRSHVNEEDPASEANDRDARRDHPKKSACHCAAAFLKLFNASSDLITISSPEHGTLLDVNESFLRVTGYDRDSVVGHTVSELGLWPPGCFTCQDTPTTRLPAMESWSPTHSFSRSPSRPARCCRRFARYWTRTGPAGQRNHASPDARAGPRHSATRN